MVSVEELGSDRCRTRTEVVSDLIEEMMGGMITCLVMVRWELVWNQKVKWIKPTGFEGK